MILLRDFIQSLDRSEIALFRKAENIAQKISKCRSAILFNKTCLKERIVPKYTDICQSESQNVSRVRLFKFKLSRVSNELKDKLEAHRALSKELQEAQLNFLATCRYFHV